MNTFLILSNTKKRKPLFVVVLLASLLLFKYEVSFSQFSNVTISSGTTANGTFVNGVFTPTANNAVLNLTTLQNALISGANNVVINTTCGSCNQAGNVTVSAITALRTATLSQLTFTINAGTAGTISTGAINVAGSATGGSPGTGRHGTNVTLNAGSTLTIGGAITTSGSRRGSAVGGDAGDITLVSGANVIIATGVITATGFAASGGNSDGGDGGNITIQAGTGIRLTQNITANGGLPAGTGIGGDAGNVIIENGSTTVTTGGGINDGQTAGVITLTPAAGGGAVGTLTKQGAGTFVLNGSNAFTGSTTINGGLLRIDADLSLGTAPGAPSAGHITLNGGGLSSSATFTLNANRSISIGSSGGTIDVASGTTLTFTGLVDGGNNLTKTSAGTLTFGAGDVTVNDLAISAGTFNASTGTTFIAGNFTNSGTFNHSSGTVDFNGSGSQNIAGVTYFNLETSIGGTKTLAGTTTVNSVLTVGASSTLDLSTRTLNLAGSGTPLVVTGIFTPSTSTVNYTNASSTNVTATNYNNLNLTGGARVLAGSGTIGIAGTFTPGAGGFTLTGSTISFNGSGAQNIPAFTYNNLSTATGGIKTFTGTVTVNSVLTIGASSTLDLSSQTLNLAGTGTPLVVTGTFTPSTSTVNYTNAASTNVTATNYNNLNLTGGARVLAASGTIGIAGTFTPGAGSITVTGSTVDFNGNGAQSIPTLSSGYNNLTASNSGTKTAGNLTINAQLTVANGVTLAMGTNAISGASITTSGTGLITTQAAANAIPAGRTWTMEVAYNAAGAQNVIGGTYATLTTSVSGIKTAIGNITATNLSVASGVTLAMGTNTISGASLTTSGTGLITTQAAASALPSGRTWSMEVEYNAAGAQSVIGGTYVNLTASTSGTKTATGAITINSQLEIASGVTVSMGTNQLLGASLTTTGTGILITGVTASSALPNGREWSMHVEYDAAGNQLIASGIYQGNLTIKGDGINRAMQGNVTVQGILALNAGTLDVEPSNTLNIMTSVTNAAGKIDASDFDAQVNFGNASPIVIGDIFPGPTDILQISGGSTVTLTADEQIQFHLNLSNGKLSIDTNILTIFGTINSSAANCLIGSKSSDIAINGFGDMGDSLFFDQTGTGNYLNNLTINRTVGGTIHIGNTTKIRGTLTPTAGTLRTNDHLVIASESTGSGRILELQAGFTINGQITVERFAKNKVARRYIFIAPQVNDISLRNAWQDDIYITGPGTGGTPCGDDAGNGGPTDKYNSNGFDETTLDLVSVYSYEQDVAARWVAAPNTSMLLKAGKGYRVLYRGPRGVNDANCDTLLTTQNVPTPDSAVLNVKGNIVTGNWPVTLEAKTSVSPTALGYTLVGNPYPCEILFSRLAEDNPPIAAIPTYYTYDPNGPTDTTGYLTVNQGDYAGGYHSGGMAEYPNPDLIASGQAFFVASNRTYDTTLLFRERQKFNQSQPGVFRTSTTNNKKIRVHFLTSASKFIDNTLIRFSADPAVSKSESMIWDAVTFNSGNFIAGIKGTRSFAIQTRPLDFINDTVMVRVVSASAGDFQLVFSDYVQFTEAAEIWLLDAFTGTTHNVKSNPVYPFTITSNAASQGGRFRLVFRSLNSVMPVSFLNISADKKGAGVEVKWNVAHESNVISYDVERSRNGQTFTVIGSVASNGFSNFPTSYVYMDNAPLPGIAYYRIKSIENDGSQYSSIVKVNSSAMSQNLSLHPNPVKDRLTISLPGVKSLANATITISNMQGVQVMQTTLQAANTKMIDVSGFSNGVYLVLITTRSGEIYQDKFVKF